MNYNQTSNEQSKPPCHQDCWHYDVFGGVEGCGQEQGGWGGWPEPIEPGQACLYPEKRNMSGVIFVMSGLGFCAALEGTVIVGGEHDNTKLVRILTGSQVQIKSKK